MNPAPVTHKDFQAAAIVYEYHLKLRCEHCQPDGRCPGLAAAQEILLRAGSRTEETR